MYLKNRTLVPGFTTQTKASRFIRYDRSLSPHDTMHQVCFYPIFQILRYNNAATQQLLRDLSLRLYRLLYPRLLELPLEPREDL